MPAALDGDLSVLSLENSQSVGTDGGFLVCAVMMEPPNIRAQFNWLASPRLPPKVLPRAAKSYCSTEPYPVA